MKRPISASVGGRGSSPAVRGPARRPEQTLETAGDHEEQGSRRGIGRVTERVQHASLVIGPATGLHDEGSVFERELQRALQHVPADIFVVVDVGRHSVARPDRDLDEGEYAVGLVGVRQNPVMIAEEVYLIALICLDRRVRHCVHPFCRFDALVHPSLEKV